MHFSVGVSKFGTLGITVFLLIQNIFLYSSLGMMPLGWKYTGNLPGHVTTLMLSACSRNSGNTYKNTRKSYQDSIKPRHLLGKSIIPRRLMRLVVFLDFLLT